MHRAFGLSDRETKRPMPCDSYFAVRSMTKPFTGMAAQILIDAGKLELDMPVAKYLSSFDNDRSRAITIRQLLTHNAEVQGAVDPHSADQILIPLALAPGRSAYTVSEITEHLRTNAQTVRAFLDREITVEEAAGGRPGRVIVS